MEDHVASTPATTSNRWDDHLERIRLQLPAAPAGLLNLYVAWAPWIAMVFGVLSVVVLVGLLALGAALGPFLLFADAAGGAGGAGVAAGLGLILFAVPSLGVSVMEVVGGFLMRSRRLPGWWLVGLGIVVNLVLGLMHVDAVGLMVSLLVAYLHLQVKPRYS
jgi:hypothetical protein